MMSEKMVGLHFGPKDDIQKHDTLLQRNYAGVIENVRNNGHDVFVTRGADHYDFRQGTVNELWLPRIDDGTIETRRVIGETAIDAMGSVRDFGKLLRPTAEHPLALINDPALVAYDESKLSAFRDVLFDRQVATVAVRKGAEQLVDTLEGAKIVVKPDKGSGGRGVEVIGRSDIRAAMLRNPDVALIAQEFADTRHAFPSAIRGLNEDEQSKMNALQGRRKELRVYAFRGPRAYEAIPVARFMKEGDEASDTWVHLDADTVPEELIMSSKIVADRLATKTSTGEVFAAVDHVWSSTAKQPEVQWRIGEINLWKPAFARKGNPSAARRYDKAVADQLVRLARSNDEEGMA